jgi:acetyltransferase-like isoleucine patch superfamily enzyme
MPSTRYIGNSKIEVGDYTYNDTSIAIYQWGEGASLTIGKYCSIGHSVTVFLGGDHRTDWATTYPFGHANRDVFGGEDIVGHPKTNGDVRIGNDVWLGADCKIMSGITIGDGAVIAGSAVVVKDVEPYSIVGGNPAKHLKYRFDPTVVDLLKELSWWNLPAETVKTIIHGLCAAPTEKSIRSLIAQVRA